MLIGGIRRKVCIRLVGLRKLLLPEKLRAGENRHVVAIVRSQRKTAVRRAEPDVRPLVQRAPAVHGAARAPFLHLAAELQRAHVVVGDEIAVILIGDRPVRKLDQPAVLLHQPGRVELIFIGLEALFRRHLRRICLLFQPVFVRPVFEGSIDHGDALRPGDRAGAVRRFSVRRVVQHVPRADVRLIIFQHFGKGDVAAALAVHRFQLAQPCFVLPRNMVVILRFSLLCKQPLHGFGKKLLLFAQAFALSVNEQVLVRHRKRTEIPLRFLRIVLFAVRLSARRKGEQRKSAQQNRQQQRRRFRKPYFHATISLFLFSAAQSAAKAARAVRAPPCSSLFQALSFPAQLIRK